MSALSDAAAPLCGRRRCGRPNAPGARLAAALGARQTTADGFAKLIGSWGKQAASNTGGWLDLEVTAPPYKHVCGCLGLLRCFWAWRSMCSRLGCWAAAAAVTAAPRARRVVMRAGRAARVLGKGRPCPAAPVRSINPSLLNLPLRRSHCPASGRLVGSLADKLNPSSQAQSSIGAS